MGRMKFMEMEGPQQSNCKYICTTHSLGIYSSILELEKNLITSIWNPNEIL